MVKGLTLARSTEELQKKAENVQINERADEKTLLRYIKAAQTVFTKAESVYLQGDEEQAYIYFIKYFHVYTQLRSTHEYINKSKVLSDEMNKILPIEKCKKALKRAEKLKESLDLRYNIQEANKLKARQIEEDTRRVEEERIKELAELERLKIEASRPSVDAASLFSSTAFSTPLVPLGHSAKDIIPKEPFISAIELMHIIEAKMKVLLIDIRTLDEFKNSHVMHDAVIFISKDYLQINTKLTSNELRELILMKDHRLLWDQRAAHDLIVIFDTDSNYDTLAHLSTHPVNIIRECSTDCLDPNFINSDLPKVLDGGYCSWVYHFPKHCTNPDRAKKPKAAVPKVRRSAPASLRPRTTAPAIYPLLNHDTEPKPISLIPPAALSVSQPETPPDTVSLPPHTFPSGPISSTSTILPSGASTPSIVTCGNVQISMPQSPQTIQINQWNQDQHITQDRVAPQEQPQLAVQGIKEHSSSNGAVFQNPSNIELLPQSSTQQTAQPLPSQSKVPYNQAYGTSPQSLEPRSQGNLNKRGGSLRITDIYEETPVPPSQFGAPLTPNVAANSSISAASASHSQPAMVRDNVMTTFPTKIVHPKPPDPIYAQVVAKKKIPNNIVPPSNSTKSTVEYADITSIRPPPDIKPPVDRSIKPTETVQSSVFLEPPAARASQVRVSPIPHPQIQPHAQPSTITHPQIQPHAQPSTITHPPQPNKPHRTSQVSPHSSQQQVTPQEVPRADTRPVRPAISPPPAAQTPSLPATPNNSAVREQNPAQPPLREQKPAPLNNPTVNRVVKPLSARATEEKYMKMMPGYGSVQLGTCGLKNIGNTCFMNAVLQCLSAVAPLTRYFITGSHKQEINPDNPLGTQGLVAEEYAFLVRAMWSDKFRFLSPKDWKEAIGRFRPQFLDYSQKDCQEFTSFMLDALHEDLNRVSKEKRGKQKEIDFSKMSYKEGSKAAWERYKSQNDSIIVDLFQGQFRNMTRCNRCGYESVTFDTFMYLTVPVGNSRTDLKTCIENFCQSEEIEWRCDKCHVFGSATKDITIWVLPVILVVILKRFSYSGMWRDKISTFVDFPTTNFRAMGKEVGWVSNKEEGRVYRLFGVTNHTGTLEGGHYIGCARNPVSGDWFTYDDHVIRPMKADQTRKKEAYLLFYTSISEQRDVTLVSKRS